MVKGPVTTPSSPPPPPTFRKHRKRAEIPSRLVPPPALPTRLVASPNDLLADLSPFGPSWTEPKKPRKRCGGGRVQKDECRATMPFQSWGSSRPSVCCACSDCVPRVCRRRCPSVLVVLATRKAKGPAKTNWGALVVMKNCWRQMLQMMFIAALFLMHQVRAHASGQSVSVKVDRDEGGRD